mmetsp:Transcript_26916/g.62587  ORF Transcript_26916/g.62587 Transcript_26916/m.62587 type:complete len:441 (-) Transcript_26916:557-1879(-)
MDALYKSRPGVRLSSSACKYASKSEMNVPEGSTSLFSTNRATSSEATSSYTAAASHALSCSVSLRFVTAAVNAFTATSSVSTDMLLSLYSALTLRDAMSGVSTWAAATKALVRALSKPVPFKWPSLSTSVPMRRMISALSKEKLSSLPVVEVDVVVAANDDAVAVSANLLEVEDDDPVGVVVSRAVEVDVELDVEVDVEVLELELELVGEVLVLWPDVAVNVVKVDVEVLVDEDELVVVVVLVLVELDTEVWLLPTPSGTVVVSCKPPVPVVLELVELEVVVLLDELEGLLAVDKVLAWDDEVEEVVLAADDVEDNVDLDERVDALVLEVDVEVTVEDVEVSVWRHSGRAMTRAKSALLVVYCCSFVPLLVVYIVVLLVSPHFTVEPSASTARNAPEDGKMSTTFTNRDRTTEDSPPRLGEPHDATVPFVLKAAKAEEVL